LEPGGLLLVQVPDFSANPFDLAVADHCSHFHPEGLETVARSAGYEIVLLERGLVAKELTLVARRPLLALEDHVAKGRSALASDPRPRALEALAWLTAVLAQARGLGQFGVFGTSIGGAWLYGQMEEGVRFFVDEDANRVGRELFGRPVLRPEQAPAGATVFFCLPRAVAEGIVSRLSGCGCRFVLPPDYPILKPVEMK